MTAKVDGGFVPRKVRKRHRMRRYQNLIFGVFFFTIAATYLSLHVYNKVNGNSMDLGDFNKKLRGPSEERSIWVSQNSQPFVSFVDRVFRKPLKM